MRIELMPAFIISHNDRIVGTLVFDKSPITIGRAPDNTITIPNAAISRHHLRIEKSNKGYILTDQDSMNGTMVNHTRVQTALLKSGDRLIIGPYSILFEESGAAPVAAANGPQAGKSGVLKIPAASASSGPAMTRRIPMTEKNPANAAALAPTAPGNDRTPASAMIPSIKDKVRAICSQRPFLSESEIRARLEGDDSGKTGISDIELQTVLTSLDLDTRLKRHRFFLQSQSGGPRG